MPKPTVEDTNGTQTREDRVIQSVSRHSTGVTMSGHAPKIRVRRALRLAVGLLGGLTRERKPPGALTYACSGRASGRLRRTSPGRLDTDLPRRFLRLQRTTTWNIQVVAPDSSAAGHRHLGSPSSMAGRNPARRSTGRRSRASTWRRLRSACPPRPARGRGLQPQTTTVPASAPGHHILSLASLTLVISFYAADGSPRYPLGDLRPRLGALADTTIDAYDTSRPPQHRAGAEGRYGHRDRDLQRGRAGRHGHVLGRRQVREHGGRVGQGDGQAPRRPARRLHGLGPVRPHQPSELATSTGTASYVAPQIVTKTKASASYGPSATC